MVTIEPLLFEAELYLARGDVDRAAALFQAAQALDQGRSELPAVGIARIGLLTGKVEQARTILSSILRAKPSSPAAAVFWAVAEEATRPIGEALPAFIRAVELAPSVWFAHANLGRALAQLGRHAEAIASLQKALSLQPGEVSVLVLLGSAQAFAGQHAASIVTFTEAVARAPQRIDPVLCLADTLCEVGHLDEARKLLRDAATRFPTAASVRSKLASISLRLGDAEGARASLREQLALTPADHEAWLFLGVLALGALDAREATVAAEKAMELDPKSSRPWFLLGQVQELIKQRRVAIDCYRQAAKLDRAAWQPRVNAAILLTEFAQRGDLDVADRLLNEAATVVDETNRSLVEFNQALTAARRGDKAAARTFATRALRGPETASHVAESRRLVQALAA
jgi:tetratricopeptide (TPR) repeat protein